MKEYPCIDYPVMIRDASHEFLEGFSAFVAQAFLVRLNRAVDLAVLPELPATPWPPRYPIDWESARSRDLALAHAFAVSDVVVAPALSIEPSMRTVRFTEASELPHTAFWIAPERHRALIAELQRPQPHRDGPIRKSEVDRPTLLWVLDELIPKAELLPSARELLCLPPQASST